MGNTVTRASLSRNAAQNAAAVVAKNTNSALHQHNREAKKKNMTQVRRENGYANDLRPRELGRAPPVTERVAPRAKPLPSYFTGRDTLEEVREKLRYQSDLDRFQKRVGVPCSNACGHSFCRPEYCSCDAYRRYSLLGKANVDSNAPMGAMCGAKNAGKKANTTVAGDADMRSAYDRESATLAKQIVTTNKQLAQQRNGSLYDGAQQSVRGADAIARRPVASVQVEKAVRKNGVSGDERV